MAEIERDRVQNRPMSADKRSGFAKVMGLLSEDKYLFGVVWVGLSRDLVSDSQDPAIDSYRLGQAAFC